MRLRLPAHRVRSGEELRRGVSELIKVSLVRSARALRRKSPRSLAGWTGGGSTPRNASRCAGAVGSPSAEPRRCPLSGGASLRAGFWQLQDRKVRLRPCGDAGPGDLAGAAAAPRAETCGSGTRGRSGARTRATARPAKGGGRSAEEEIENVLNRLCPTV